MKRMIRGLVSTCVIALLIVLPVPAAVAADSDGDGMPNAWERTNGTRPRVADARRDYDRDGLRNIAEYRNGTRPLKPDTDQDGAWDGQELEQGTDPLDPDTDNDSTLDGDEDADADGVANEDENDSFLCDVRGEPDIDGDGVANEDENDFGMSTRDRDSDDDGTEDGDEDTDNDGIANEDEDDRDQAICVWRHQVQNALKNGATAEESYATGNQGAYTTSLEDLRAEGWSPPSEDVTMTIVEADAYGYCLEAVHEDWGETWHYDSDAGTPQEGPCGA